MVFSNGFEEVGLWALRLALAAVFLVHGLKKVTGAKQVGGFLAFIGVCETLGGLAVLIGFQTTLAALGLAIIMLGALSKKLFAWHVPFTAQDKMGWEFDLVLLAALLALASFGTSAYSVDSLGFLPFL